MSVPVHRSPGDAAANPSGEDSPRRDGGLFEIDFNLANSDGVNTHRRCDGEDESKFLACDTAAAYVDDCPDSWPANPCRRVQIRPWERTACSPIAEASRSRQEGCRCKSCHVNYSWHANRASESGLGANECVPSGKWSTSTAFRQFLRA